MIGRKTENIEVKKKKFEFSKNFDKPQWVYLCDQKVIKSGAFSAIPVFAIPSETIEMKGNFTGGVDIKGGKFYQEQDLMNEYKGQAYKDIKALWKWYSDNVNDSNRDSIEKVVDERITFAEEVCCRPSCLCQAAFRSGMYRSSHRRVG